MLQPASGIEPIPSPICIERAGDILIVRLARPEKRNALNDALVQSLSRAFSEVPEGVKAAVLCAEGDHFSAGLDLSELTERDASQGFLHSRMWHDALDRVQFGRVPVVSVLRGAVVGGGLELAAATHIRVAEQSAFYALPEGSRGIFVGGGGSVRLPRLIGIGRVTDMLLTGRVIAAAEGQSIGISERLVEEGQGLPLALQLAHRIAENAPLTNYAVIHALPRIAESNRDSGLFMEALMASITQDAPVAKERLRDFLAKRAKKVGE